MSETKDKETTEEKPTEAKKKTLSLGGTLSLKPSGTGAAKRGDSGRGKPGVAVEVKRRRTTPAPVKEAPKADLPADSGDDENKAELRNLTDEEREARVKALKLAEEEAKRKEEQAKIDAEKAKEDAQNQKVDAVSEAERKRQEEMEALKKIEEEEAKKREEDILAAQTQAEQNKKFTKPAAKASDIAAQDEAEEESFREKMKRQAQRRATRSTDNRRRGKITVTQVLNEDYDRDRGKSLAAQRRAKEKARLAGQNRELPEKIVREVIIPEVITVQELANRMAERGADVIKELMKMGMMVTITQTIDADTAELIAEELGHKVKRVTDADVEEGMLGEDDDPKDMKSRPPVVTIMGHVDHGKTSLLDALRATDVVAGEAGGITQHIGAYQVTMPTGARITFLDTPGHAAFTEMRSRGANVTDIVVLVVAANDSLMPQTIEAINHAKAAQVPIIVAINKIDLPDANVQKVKNDLLTQEVVLEDFGGDVMCVEVSAKQKTNLDKLEETILLQSEVMEIKANPDREASGTVVEAKLEQGRGNVATILVQRGTLKIGDVFVVGAESGKVRAIINDRGENIQEAIPGQPVEILGLNGAPEAGDQFAVVKDENKARSISEYRQRKRREAENLKRAKSSSFEMRLAAARDTDRKEIAIVIKADVHGSVEALGASLKKIEEDNEGVSILILHSGVGGITESDVSLANASGGIIIGFNVRANAQARAFAEAEAVDIRYYNVIYNAIDDLKSILSGMLDPVKREEYLGQAEIKQVFRVSKVGNVAGCIVSTGKVERGAGVRLLRDDVVIHEGTLKTLQRFQDEVKEVKEGTECGMAFENYDDIKEGDVIECFEVIEEARTLE